MSNYLERKKIEEGPVKKEDNLNKISAQKSLEHAIGEDQLGIEKGEKAINEETAEIAQLRMRLGIPADKEIPPSVQEDRKAIEKMKKEEEFKRVAQQEWEVICQEMLDEFWDHFGEHPLDDLQKTQRWLGKDVERDRGRTSSIQVLDKQNPYTLRFPPGFQEKLRKLYNKGITNVKTIFAENPEIKNFFEQPQLLRAAEKRAEERLRK